MNMVAGRAEQEAAAIEAKFRAVRYPSSSAHSHGHFGAGELPSHTHSHGDSKFEHNEERIRIRYIDPKELFGQYDVVVDEPIRGRIHDYVVFDEPINVRLDEKVDVKCSILKAYHNEEQRLLNAMYSDMLKSLYGAVPRKKKILLLCGR